MDTLSDYRYTMESCNSCGQCRFILGPKMKGWDHAEVCPIYSKYQFEAYSGQGLIHIAQELLEGELEYNDELIEHVYTCTTCGACDVNCKSVRDMEVLDTILALRAKCVEDGQGPMPVHREYSRHVENHYNLFGRPHAERFDWITDDLTITEGADVLYFTGCTTSYYSSEIARCTAKILNAGGMEFTVLNSDEHCCGAMLWRTGQRQRAKKLAEHNLEAITKRGIKTVIFSCAECLGTFKGFYPRFQELNFETWHISQIIQKMLLDGTLTLTKTLPMKATYHDPCLLGRLSELYVPWKGEIKAFGYHDPPKQWRRGTHGIYQAPRDVLKAIPGLELFEMTRNAENAFCCGGGGGVLAAFPDFARWTARERLDEAKAAGAEAIISCCPWCQMNFKKTIQTDSMTMRYYDLTEVVARAL